jgi:hypothetical protein
MVRYINEATHALMICDAVQRIDAVSAVLMLLIGQEVLICIRLGQSLQPWQSFAISVFSVLFVCFQL